MQEKELGNVPVVVEATWEQQRSSELRDSFVKNRLAELALLDHDELDFDSEQS